MRSEEGAWTVWSVFRGPDDGSLPWDSGYHLPPLWVPGGRQVVSLVSIFEEGTLRPKGAHLVHVLEEPERNLGTQPR